MSKATDNLLSYIRVMAGSWRNDPRDDAELIARFAEKRDEIAFAALVSRHGTLVWQTCRRLLGDTPDAEDAFQTVFLALTRKAGRFPVKNLVGWLYRVAHQTALKARSRVRSRQNLEQAVAKTEAKEDVSQDELYVGLDEELAQLPEKLRVPLLMHYVEGKSQVEVAEILGCARRAVQKRLEKGEAVLRGRLERRGLTLGAVSMAALLGNKAGTSAVPAGLIQNTARAAMAFRAGTFTGVTADAAQKLLQTLAVQRTTRASWWLVLACVGLFGVGGAGLMVWKICIGVSGTARPEASSLSTAYKMDSNNPADSKSRDPQIDIYGDPLPEGAIARLGTVRWRNTRLGMFVPVAFAFDGKVLIAAIDNGLLYFEFPSGKLLKRIIASEESPWEACNVITVTKDCKLMAIATNDGDVELRDLVTGTHAGLLKGDKKQIKALAFLSDNTTLLTGTSKDKTVKFWNAITHKEIRRQEIILSSSERQQTCEMSLDPDSQTLAIGQTNNVVRLQNLKTAKTTEDITLGDFATKTPDKDKKKITTTKIEGVAFSASGNKLTTIDANGQVTLWDLPSRKCILRIKSKGGIADQHIPLSPDETMLAARGEDHGRVVDLWDVKNGVKIHSLPVGDPMATIRMIFSPDGKTLVTGGTSPTLKLWNVFSGKEIPCSAGHEHMVKTVAFAPDGKTIVSGDGDCPGEVNDRSLPQLLTWDVKTCKLEHQQVKAIPSEKLAGCFDLDQTTGSIAGYSPDGAIIFSVGMAYNSNNKLWQDTVWMWDAKSRKHLQTLKLNQPAEYVTFSPDCKSLTLWHSHTKTIDVCDVATGKRIHSLVAHALDGSLQGRVEDESLGNVTSAAYSPDGQKIVSTHSSGIALWDANTGNQLHSWTVLPEKGDTSMLSSSFTPDGKMIIFGGKSDKFIRFVELSTRTERLKIAVENDSILIAISPDGRLLATTNVDETIRLWDVITGQQIHQFPPGQGRIRSLAFSPDNKTLASGNDDTTILIWNVDKWDKKTRQLKALSQTEFQNAWSAMENAETHKAYRAMGDLIAASDQAVPMLLEKLRPPTVAISQNIKKLLADLDNDNQMVRKFAKDELLNVLQDNDEPFLRETLRLTQSVEVRTSIEKLVFSKKWTVNGVSKKYLQRLRGLEILEKINTTAAHRALQELSDLKQYDIAKEAEAALKRNEKNEHSPQ